MTNRSVYVITSTGDGPMVFGSKVRAIQQAKDWLTESFPDREIFVHERYATEVMVEAEPFEHGGTHYRIERCRVN